MFARFYPSLACKPASGALSGRYMSAQSISFTSHNNPIPFPRSIHFMPPEPIPLHSDLLIRPSQDEVARALPAQATLSSRRRSWKALNELALGRDYVCVGTGRRRFRVRNRSESKPSERLQRGGRELL